jgi:hypothetical protein
MFTNEILVRTLNAEREARENGFAGFADALGEITVNLTKLIAPQPGREVTQLPRSPRLY